MITCTCGHPNPDGAEFCEVCGTELREAALGEAQVGEAEAGAVGAPSVAPEAAASAAGVKAPEALAKLLVKRQAALTGEELPIYSERVVIGRFDPSTGPVDLDLSPLPESDFISKRHAELYRDEAGQWLIRDLGSTNGVFVKKVGAGSSDFGPRITEPANLQDGDEVALGNLVLVFREAS